jgi:hypothetical protein
MSFATFLETMGHRWLEWAELATRMALKKNPGTQKNWTKKAKMSSIWHMAGGCKEWFLAMSCRVEMPKYYYYYYENGLLGQWVGTKFHCMYFASAGITKSNQRYKSLNWKEKQ